MSIMQSNQGKVSRADSKTTASDSAATSVHTKNNQFPTGMFVSAALFSSIMVFVISAVFAQSNAPCISNYGMQDKVIIDTQRANIQNTASDQALAICNRNNQQIGWLTWLFRRSDSVDFHYLDLLELLSRKD